ncbi:MAG: molybdenum cofactor guanylyltransferase [Planctomycetes bacterium]|nr:molybdenum cofactor guanylyltransferase [Planctomycetota bacterium]MBL7143644.1 molybdenum cofactor guanylyltransferase [Phycisphaerae bacterium]
MLKNKMLKLDGMLIIGSAGSNVGKTELACTLLGKFGRSCDVIGIKVTTIRDKEGQCPRGGEGCGACSSLEGAYSITEELDSSSEKDTARLLAAGACRVFWLRVREESLLEGITALLDVIGHDAVSICESNSLRQVVEPGLFLMVGSRNSKNWKSSAQAVKKHADRIVISDGSSFDFDPNRIKLINGKWIINLPATAIIMAGGESRRMGIDKSMLSIKGQSIIEVICEQLRGSFDEILISANQVDKFAFLGFKVVPDKVPEWGPLMGIASALEASASEYNFVVACDIPKINLNCVHKMLTEAIESRADIVVPVTGKEKYEPLFAIYRKSTLEVINKTLSSGKNKITDVFTLCKVKYIEMEDADWLINLNTIADYEEFQKKLL